MDSLQGKYVVNLTDQFKYLNVWQIYTLYLKRYPNYRKSQTISQTAYFHGLYSAVVLVTMVLINKYRHDNTKPLFKTYTKYSFNPEAVLVLAWLKYSRENILKGNNKTIK